jgi:hypothetical protein
MACYGDVCGTCPSEAEHAVTEIDQTLRATGDTVLWADLILSRKTNRSAWEELAFRIDSGTEMTTMSAFDATTLDLPIPKKGVRASSGSSDHSAGSVLAVET